MVTPEQAEALRKEFEPGQIGKLPKVSCGKCTQAAKSAQRASEKHCDSHTVRECPTCKAYITTGHIHLDYVGHAAATDRLLQVDPGWTWEPMGKTPDGVPAVDRDGNLWIWLTVCGVTRPGVGDGNSMKEKIGDAIRNAAMRFGVAIDLWAKEDLRAGEIQHPENDTPAQQEQPNPHPANTDSESLFAVKRRALVAAARLHPDKSPDDIKAWVVAAIEARGIDATSVVEVMKLAEEWESADATA